MAFSVYIAAHTQAIIIRWVGGSVDRLYGRKTGSYVYILFWLQCTLKEKEVHNKEQEKKGGFNALIRETKYFIYYERDYKHITLVCTFYRHASCKTDLRLW